MGTATGVVRDPPVFWALIVGQIAFALLLVLVLERWPNAMTFAGGAKVGAILGFLTALSFDMAIFATTNMMNLTVTLVDPIIFLVIAALTGGVVAMVLGRGGAAAA